MDAGYIAEQRARALRNSRIAAVFAAVAIMLFAFLDLAVYPDLAPLFLRLRLGVVAVSAVLYAATYLPFAKNYGRGIGMIQYVMTGMSIVVMVHLSEGYLSPYYAGINVILIVFLAILPMDPVRTAITCGIIYGGYIVPIAVRGGIDEWSVFFNNNAFLVATSILAVLSSYMYSRLRIREYESRRELARANEDLKHLDVVKSQFFANVSHEVRTPLTSIIGPIQSIYQGDTGEISDEQRTLLGQVYRNALRLLDMINQMLDFARFDAKRMQVNLSEIEIDRVVQEIVLAFGEVARAKGLELRCECDESVPPVYLDREKVERILTNLVRNAIKFTESGEVVVSVWPANGEIVITVSDTGIGIPANHVTTIFERFQQVDSSSTRRYEGTGLGLAIVKEAVEIQRGTIRVSSELGRGTRFMIRLPGDLDIKMPARISKRTGYDRRRNDRRSSGTVYTGPERRRGPRRHKDIAGIELEDLVYIDSARSVRPETFDFDGSTGIDRSAEAPGYRILYVEDNSDLRSYVAGMLAKTGYRVETAVDGQDGWERIQRFRPDVVVSDIMMPRLNGYDLLKRIRENEELKGTPVVLTTAKSETDERIHGLEEGADDYLAKPINLRELDARIRNLVTQRLFHEAIAKARSLEYRMRELTLSFSRSLDLRDHYTADHSNDVLTYGTMIAEELSIPVDESFQDALLLHDLGKLGVPDRILLKEGPLDEEEWEIMKKHAEYGAHLLSVFESFQGVSEIVLCHQERFDGSGYPRGLREEEIPITARIIAVADAWHAMIEDRPYRKALSTEQAVRELQTGAGSHFDPVVVDAFFLALQKRGVPAAEVYER
ncbi:MAG: HD domain-containing phosphohydrolase [Alkalispirochaeta sp.]